MVLEDPSDYGRVIWDEYGHVWKVVEVKDCTLEELEIKEFNVGVYCFDTEALRWDLPRLTSDTAQASIISPTSYRSLPTVDVAWRPSERTSSKTPSVSTIGRIWNSPSAPPG